MKKPYSKLEENYLIEQRVEEIIIECGSIEKAIKYCESKIKEADDIWSNCSYDCVGHSLTCNTLLVNRLKEKLLLTQKQD